MGRPRKCRCICSKPRVTRFLPENGGQGCAVIGYDEYEVMRLLDFEHYSQEQCAQKMQVSRPTVTRMYEHARHQIGQALYCPSLFQDLAHVSFAQHKQNFILISFDLQKFSTGFSSIFLPFSK